MLDTNLIPNDLRYQLEFADLPARAVPLSKREMVLLLSGALKKTIGCRTRKDCQKKNGAPKKGYTGACVNRKGFTAVNIKGTAYKVKKTNVGYVGVCRPAPAP